MASVSLLITYQKATQNLLTSLCSTKDVQCYDIKPVKY